MVTNAQIAQAANLLLPPLPLGGGLGTLQDVIESGGRSLNINNPNSPISTLISKIAAAGGVTRPNKFFVTFTFPTGFGISDVPFLGDGIADGRVMYDINDYTNSDQIHMACEISQIPGRSLTTTQTRTYGPVREFVSGKVYPPVDMTFRVHNNMIERSFFEAWQETAISSAGHDSNYPDEYLSNIVITQVGPADLAQGLGGFLSKAKGVADIFDKGGSVAKALNVANNSFKKFGALLGFEPGDQGIASYTLKDAFPAILGPLALDHGQNESYHRQSVTFNYRMWTTNLMGREVNNNVLDIVGGLVNGVLGGTVGFGASYSNR